MAILSLHLRFCLVLFSWTYEYLGWFNRLCVFCHLEKYLILYVLVEKIYPYELS
jgi:hypothetical protein